MEKKSYLEKLNISVYGALERIITSSGISSQKEIYVVNQTDNPFQAYHLRDSALKDITSLILTNEYLNHLRTQKVEHERPIQPLALVHYDDELRTLWDYQQADQHNPENIIHITLYHLNQDQRREFDEALILEMQRILIGNPSNVVPLRRV